MSMIGKMVVVDAVGIPPWVGIVEEELAGGLILRVRVTDPQRAHKHAGDRWDVGARACKEIG